MALANGGDNYTSPLSIRKFTTKLCLLPVLYTCERDKVSGNISNTNSTCDEETCILIPNELTDEDLATLPYYSLLGKAGIGTIKYDELDNSISEIHPWGWNRTLRKRLLQTGIDSSILPSESKLDAWRQLANKSTTIQAHTIIAAEMRNSANGSYLMEHMPRVFSNAHDALQYISSKRVCVLKQPWSSSGRGVFFIKNGVDKSVEQIVCGTIARQGEIVIETTWDKKLDFATEWYMTNGKARFLGYSIFKNSDCGNYIGNMVASQEELFETITGHCERDHLTATVEYLQTALEQVIGDIYDGPLGVDMLCAKNGMINPCVEINLRRTMGHITISLWEQSHVKSIFYPGR